MSGFARVTRIVVHYTRITCMCKNIACKQTIVLTLLRE